MKLRNLALSLVLGASSSAFAQSVPPCVPDPNLVPLFPIAPEPGCQCQDGEGQTIPCAAIIDPPNMGNCQCPPTNAHFWKSSCLRFYTDVDQDGHLEILDTDSKVPFAKSLSDPETRWYFADLITPEVSLPSSPYWPCEGEGIACQQSGTTLRLGKAANILNMNSVLWSGQAKWTDFSAQATGTILFSSFLSYLPSFPCVKIPRALAPGKHKVGRKFGKNTYCSGNDCPSTIVPTDSLNYVTLNLAIQGVTAPRIYDFNVQSDAAVAIAEGGPASADFRIVNYGYENIQKSYVVVYLSKQSNVLADPSKIAIGAAQVLNNGQLHLLEAASPLSGMLNQQGVIDAGDSNQKDHVYHLPLTIPENIVTLTPGKKQEIYFTAKLYVVQAQNDAPEYYPAYEAEKDKITVVPDMEITKVTFLSSSSSKIPPEICYGDKIEVLVEGRNKGLVASSPETKLACLVSKQINGNGAKTLPDSTLTLHSVAGNSTFSLVCEVYLWPEPGFKMNKMHYLKMKIIDAGLTSVDEPKKANNDSPPGQLIPFKLTCPFSPFGLAVDIDHDGAFNEDPALKLYSPGLLIPFNSNDDNQDGILDKDGSFAGNDPDLVALNVLMPQCQNQGGSWAIEYPADQIRIRNESGQVIGSNQWQSCSGQLEVLPLWIEGIEVSAQVASQYVPEAYIRLYYDTPSTAPQLIDQLVFTVFHVNVSADSDNDTQINADDELCEDVEGRLPQLIWFNCDDDDHDGKEDYLDTVLSGFEDNLVPVQVDLRPNGLAHALELHEYSMFKMSLHIPAVGEQNIALWKGSQKNPLGPQVFSGQDIAFSTLPVQYFVEGTHWTGDVSAVEARLVDDGVVIGREKVRFYSTQPGVEIVDEIWTGEDLPVAVMGFPPGTSVTMKVLRNDTQILQVQKNVGSLLAAVMEVDLDYDHNHVDHDKPGDRYKIRAIIDDGGCNHLVWDSIECVVKPGLPSGHQGGIELVSAPSGVADSNQLIPIAVRVKDDYGNLVADGTPVSFSIISADGATIEESGLEQYNALTENGMATGYIHSPKTDLIDLVVQAQSGEAKTNIQFAMDWVSGELEPALAVHANGAIDYTSIFTLLKGQPLTVRLKNTNASNGTSVYWTISSYWGPDQDAKKTRVSYVEDGESVLQIDDTAELLEGLCTITATYSGRFLHTAVYVLPLNLTDPILKIDRPLLSGEKTVNEPFTIEWLIEKPQGWPDTYPDQTLWTLASGIEYAATKAYLANLAPNHRYLLLTENPQDQFLIAVFQQPGDAGYIEGIPGIGTNDQGLSSFSIVSQGQYTAANYPADFAPQALGVRQLNFTLIDSDDMPPLQPLARSSIKLARTDTCQRILGVTGACLGGDPETIEEIATSIGFGLIPVLGVLQDTGALAKNVASMVGLRDQDTDKLETTLAMVGVTTMLFPGPDDAAKKLVQLSKEIEQGNPVLAYALVRTGERLITGGPAALTTQEAGKLIGAILDPEILEVMLTGIRSEQDLYLFAKALDKYGDFFKGAIKEATLMEMSLSLGTASKFLVTLPPKVQASIFTYASATEAVLSAMLVVTRLPESVDDLHEVLKRDELFYPSSIDGIITNYSHAQFLVDCSAVAEGSIFAPGLNITLPYLRSAIQALRANPTVTNRYRIEAVANTIVSDELPDSFAIVKGKFASRVWADALPEQASIPSTLLDIHGADPGFYSCYLAFADAVYLVKPDAKEWGKVLAPRNIVGLVSKISSGGIKTVRIVVPSLDFVSPAVKKMVQKLYTNQQIQVIFHESPIL